MRKTRNAPRQTVRFCFEKPLDSDKVFVYNGASL